MPPTQQEIDAARATLAEAGEALSNAGAVVVTPPLEGDKVGDTPAESSPTPGEPAQPAASAPDPAAPVEEAEGTPADLGQDVTDEAAAIKAAAEHPSEKTVVAAAEPVVTSALEELAKLKAENPQGDFAEHLKALADKGLAAVLNPADESAVLGALIHVVKEVVA